MKKALIVRKRNFTRNFNSCGKITQFTTAHPTSDSATAVKHCNDRLTKAYGEAMDALDELSEYDDANQNMYEQSKDDIIGRYEQMTERIISTLEEVATPPRQPAAAAPVPPPDPAAGGPAANGARFMKVNESLKPFKLTTDHNPIEFRSWCNQFKSFFNTSRLDLIQPADQQAYLRICIEPTLEARIAEKIDDQTEMFGNNSCIEFIEEEFAAKYPLATRRDDYFKLKQGDSIFSDFSAKLMTLAKEADIESLTTEDVHVHRYISGASDKKLREKFLKLEKPTLEECNRIVRAHERANYSATALDDQNKVKQIKGKGKGKGKGKPATPIDDKDLICFGCAGNHRKQNCPHSETACTYCKKRGHIEKMCNAKRIKEMAEKERKESNSKVKKTTNKSQDSTDDEEDDDEPPAHTKRVYHKIAAINTCAHLYNFDTPRMKVTVQPTTGKRNRFQFDALPDTGATRTIIAKDIAEKHGITYHPTTERLFAADDNEIACEGTAVVKIEGHRLKPLISSAIKSDIILSWHDLVTLGAIPADFPNINSVKATKTKKEDNLIDQLIEDYPDVLSDELPKQPMNGKPMKILLDHSKPIKPKKVTGCKPIPIHYQEEAMELINSLIKDGIIQEVHDETTDWVSPAFFVPKPNGKLRLVTDFTHLNRYIKRPVHPFPYAQDIMKNIPPGTKVFAKLDALQGYHQVPLDEESQLLTTFLLPTGKYKYLRGPMGLRSTNDVYCAKSDKTTHGVPSTQKIVDDILVCAENYKQLEERVRKVLDNCRTAKITISKKKLTIGENIDFAGFSISQEGITPDKEKVKSLTEFPPPTNITELRSFLGLANQLGGFIENLAAETEPLRHLLKKGVAYIWNADHQKTFEEVREKLSSPLLVHYFDPKLRTMLLSDASNLHGIGFALVQYDSEDKMKLVQCGSRTLSPTEGRYAPIELESLGITSAIERCRHFLLGHPLFNVITDH